MPFSYSVRGARAIGATAILASFALTSLTGGAHAHEFWVEARDYTLAPGEALTAELRVGQQFKGNAITFNPNRHTRFDVLEGGRSVPVASRIGDSPAVDQAVTGDEGLAIVLHQTTDTTLSYDDEATFRQFIDDEGLDGTLEAHAARGLPGTGFREAYSRHVKALVDTGPGGMDRALGLPIEVVVEGDPYAEPMPASVMVRALYDGEPMSGALLNVFTRTEGDAREETDQLRLRLDEEGRVAVPLEPGRRYLANVVKMREPSADKAEAMNVVWESLWASTTFSTED